MNVEQLVLLGVSLVCNIFVGTIGWFMKTSYNDLKDRVERHDESLEKVKDTYFKKEDFRDFKTELFFRLDKIEKSFEKKWEHIKGD